MKTLSFDESNNTFFGNSIIDGREKNIFGLEVFPHIINAAGLCICTNGDCSISIESKSYHMEKGNMCVVFPNDVLFLRNKSTDFMGYTAACTPEFLNSVNIASGTSIYLYIKGNPCILLNKDELTYMLKLLDFLKIHDSLTDHPCRNEISRSLVACIIYEVIGIYKSQTPLEQQPYSRKNKIFFDFTDLVVANFKKEKNVAFYAGKLCITPRHLSSVCKEITGNGAKQCIDNHVINNIYALLSSTDLTIAQISEKLNFPNASFFTKFFKKHTGQTPRQYRNMNFTLI
ncbi:MAG: helix-turn-helix domain-containing protein [Bacteroidales bacterium]|jgi:AraC-like DNA-binding protein|nr:helix-turn-helix domain-containing protein [Bacteroidales bacterium]